jgi:DNA-directed RNA polymerase specialized sigma24 family protein
VILRRRDDYARVLRELGGQLFARGGEVDSYFSKIYDQYRAQSKQVQEPSVDWFMSEERPTDEEVALAVAHIVSYRRDKMLREIQEHIRTAPERESAALRLANIRQACHAR